ncbi:MAG: hypothetical protein O2795_16445 [Acidobacteria bacterium]|nr:hypothetical protein [Acidobacteriota bacterium]
MANFSPTHDHERSDAHVRPVALFLVFMFCSVLAAYGLITVLFEYLSQRQISKYGNPVEFSAPGEKSGAPQLQVVPGLDLRGIRAEEAEQLDGYGWVDQRQGLVHIPIEQAIDMLLEQGVATRGADAAE